MTEGVAHGRMSGGYLFHDEVRHGGRLAGPPGSEGGGENVGGSAARLCRP